MKKSLKKGLKILAFVLLLLLLVAVGGWFYLKSKLLNFEGNYVENTELKEVTIAGFTFLDRNGNGELDVYEDKRKTT